MNPSEQDLQVKLEREVLGALLSHNNRDLLYEAIEELEPYHFWAEKHRTIYTVLVEAFVKNNCVDFVMLSSELDKRGLLESVGGAPYLTELQPSTFLVTGAKYRIRELKERARIRDLKALCGYTIRSIDEKDFESPEELAEKLGDEAYRIVYERPNEIVDIRSVAEHVIDVAKNLDRGEVSGYSWGLRKLDFLTSGIELRKTYVVGGTKKTGKSKFVINTLWSLHRQAVRSLFLSLEMDGEAVVRELLSRFAGVENMAMKRKLDLATEERLREVFNEIDDGKITVDTTPYLTVNQVRAKVRRAARNGLKVVFIDYIQRMDFQLRQKKELNFATVISHTVSQLADIAKENDVAIVILSQLANRAEKQEATIADLKDSGGIAEGADCILILNNQDRIKKSHDEKTNEVWITVEQRSGASGRIKCNVDLSKAIYEEKLD